jgi:hypothetical protein
MSAGTKGPSKTSNAQVLRDWMNYLTEVFEMALPYLERLVEHGNKMKPLINEFVTRSKDPGFWRDALSDLPKDAAGNLFFALTVLPEISQKLNVLATLPEPEQDKVFKDIRSVLQSLRDAKTKIN